MNTIILIAIWGEAPVNRMNAPYKCNQILRDPKTGTTINIYTGSAVVGAN